MAKCEMVHGSIFEPNATAGFWTYCTGTGNLHGSAVVWMHNA